MCHMDVSCCKVCVRVYRRCADLEERERELLRNQGSLQEALVQVGARAQAAEEKLEKRIEELQAEHKEVIAVMTTNAAASLEVRFCKAVMCNTTSSVLPHWVACLWTDSMFPSHVAYIQSVCA